MKHFFSKMAIAILIMLVAAVSAMSQTASSTTDKQSLSSQVLSTAGTVVDSVKSIATQVDTASVSRQIYSDVRDAVGAIASGY